MPVSPLCCLGMAVSSPYIASSVALGQSKAYGGPVVAKQHIEKRRAGPPSRIQTEEKQCGVPS